MFLRKRFFVIAFCLAIVASIGLISNIVLIIAEIGIAALALACVVDIVVLLFTKLDGQRIMAQKLDLGETNKVTIKVAIVRGKLNIKYFVDELPAAFHYSADNSLLHVDNDGRLVACYAFTPSQRGAYTLGRLLVFGSLLGLVERRFVVEQEGRAVDVYPAFSHLREKEQQARSLQVISQGSHKLQRPANQTEFKDIREYVPGDDIRTVNWKATARVGRTMVNNYEDERSQHIINIIDCGRAMHRTFNNLTLQDYAINASLLLTYSALHTEGDNVGLITYGPKGIDYLPSRGGDMQLNNVMKHLYHLDTEYGEGDMEELCLILDRQVQKRSLIVLYTDYTTMASLERQFTYLNRISRRHCLVVVSFLDNSLKNVSERKYSVSETNVTYFVESSIASGLMLQKQSIVDKLQQHGIHCLMTTPEHISFDVLRKYIDLKARHAW